MKLKSICTIIFFFLLFSCNLGTNQTALPLQLKSLSLSAGAMVPDFTPSQQHYWCNIDSEQKEIIVQAHSFRGEISLYLDDNQTSASPAGQWTVPLKKGFNKINFKLEEDNESINYQLNIFQMEVISPGNDFEEEINSLMDDMSWPEKVGQLFMPMYRYVAKTDGTQLLVDDIKNYHLGAILIGPQENIIVEDATGKEHSFPPFAALDKVDFRSRIDDCQAAALPGSSIPLIISIDAVHGNSMCKDGTIFPHNIALAASRDPDLFYEEGRVTAKELQALGVNMALAPCVAIVRDPRWGRFYEGIGETPEWAEGFTSAFVQGMQGAFDGSASFVSACPKHFIGDGGTDFGSGPGSNLRIFPDDQAAGPEEALDKGNVSLSEDALRALFLPPYMEAVENKSGAIMLSYSSWKNTKCHLNPKLVRDLLKTELGFDGIVLSDYGGINNAAPSLPIEQAYSQAFNAGVDMIMIGKNWREIYKVILHSVENDGFYIDGDMINTAVRRILRVKFRMGLLNHLHQNRPELSVIGQAEHRKTASESAAACTVLLKNEELLPFGDKEKIFILGEGADSIDRLCGGWTVGWHKTTGWQSEFGGAYPDYAVSYKNALSEKLINLDNSLCSSLEESDIVVFVISEPLYAEHSGDRKALDISESDKKDLDSAIQSGKKVLVVQLSGRPLNIKTYLDKVDGWIMAWLPGPDPRALINQLFGEIPFKGKLPVSWPSNPQQYGVNPDEAGYNPLFPIGYGLE